VVRYLEIEASLPVWRLKPPLRVLGMVSAPSDLPPLDVEGEWAKLEAALRPLEQRGTVALERVRSATLSDLQSSLRRGTYHVFHFIGHGDFDEQAQDGVLAFTDEYGRGLRMNAQYLGTLLHDHRSLRLAVLNACEGARTSAQDPFAGSAQSLIQQGLPAVIAMQFEITDQAANTFAGSFYSALADGYPADAALAEARKAIFVQGNDIEWGTPVLFTRTPDGRIFELEQPPAAEPAPLPAIQAAPPRADSPAAAAKLAEAQRQEELAKRYEQARSLLRAEEWSGALARLEALEREAPGYKDVRALLATVRQRAAARPAKPIPEIRSTPAGWGMVLNKALGWGVAWGAGWSLFWLALAVLLAIGNQSASDVFIMPIAGGVGGMAGGTLAGGITLGILRAQAARITWKHMAASIRTWIMGGSAGFLVGVGVPWLAAQVGASETPDCSGMSFSDCLGESLGAVIGLVLLGILAFLVACLLTGLLAGSQTVRRVRSEIGEVSSGQAFWVVAGWGLGTVAGLIASLVMLGVLSSLTGN
jgi:hypothetical protein